MIYQGECSLRKQYHFKKEEKYGKLFKNEEILKVTKGDILGLESIETKPVISNGKDKEKICKIQKVLFENTLVVLYHKIGY